LPRKLGFAKDSDVRAEAGILYVLHQLSDEGHVYYPFEPLIEKCQEILGVEREVITKALQTIASQDKIVIEDLGQEADKKAVYLAKFHFSETSVAERIKTLRQCPQIHKKDRLGEGIGMGSGSAFHHPGRKADRGGEDGHREQGHGDNRRAGTGKTTIINAILKIFSKLKVAMLLLPLPEERQRK
jgi:exodeoxyribonuclease V alpha subunit